MIKDIKSFCRLFYESTFLPINCYDYASDQSYTYPEDAGFDIIVNNPSPDFLNFKKNPDYFVILLLIMVTSNHPDAIIVLLSDLSSVHR